MGKFYLTFVLVCLSLSAASMATVYMVGDSGGWDISTDLDAWASGKEFNVGDTLLFLYSSLHSVSQVAKDAFDGCTATNAIGSSGNTSIPLTTPGPKYFICGTPSHCFGGMRLEVNVKGEAAASPVSAPVVPDSSQDGPSSSLPRPTSKNNNPMPYTPSIAFFYGARDAVSVAWWSVLGTLLWVALI